MTNPFSIALTRIRRSPYQASAAVLIMTMTLFLAGSFFIIAAGSEAILKFFESRPQVIGYFKPEISPDSNYIASLSTKLQSTGLVDKIQFTSKDQAFQIYTTANLNSPLLLEGVTAGLLPASIEVSSTRPDSLKTIAEELKKESDISEVQFPEDIVAPFVNWTKSVRIIGTSLVGVHVFITLSIVMLIISVKIASRREEITVFQILGATSAYISWPFIIEGFLYGLAGGFLAWGIAYLALLYSMGFWVGFLAGIPILPPPIWFMLSVLGGELALGAFIGGLGGLFAVHRFLKR